MMKQKIKLLNNIASKIQKSLFDNTLSCCSFNKKFEISNFLLKNN